MTEETSPSGPAPVPAVSAPGIADNSPALEHTVLATGFPGQEDGTTRDSLNDTSTIYAAAQGGHGLDVNADTSIRVGEAEVDAIREHVYPQPQTPAFSGTGTEDLRGGYAAIVGPAASSPLSIGAAGLVANILNGPVTVAPQIRVRDVLTGSPVDRVAVRDDTGYAETGEWRQARRAVAGMLRENRVLVVVAPRGYGSTAFSLRLLACHAREDAELLQLEADWKSPKIDKLPLQEKCAYQLDLQDPDHDRFDGAFLNGLGKHAADLKALGSYLVLAVADELWHGHHGQVPPEVNMLRLDEPPDALQLVEHRLTAQGLESLVPYALQPEGAKHIEGRDAVQAMRAVDTESVNLNEAPLDDVY